MSVLSTDLGHYIIKSVQDLNFVLLVHVFCLTLFLRRLENILKDTFKQNPAVCALLSFLELCLYQI